MLIFNARAWLVFIGSESILAGVLWIVGLLSPLSLILFGLALLAALWVWDHRPQWIPQNLLRHLGWLDNLLDTKNAHLTKPGPQKQSGKDETDVLEAGAPSKPKIASEPIASLEIARDDDSDRYYILQKKGFAAASIGPRIDLTAIVGSQNILARINSRKNVKPVLSGFGSIESFTQEEYAIRIYYSPFSIYSLSGDSVSFKIDFYLED